jgi:hypothetical protein
MILAAGWYAVVMEACRDIAVDAKLPPPDEFGPIEPHIAPAFTRGRVKGRASHSPSLKRMLRKSPRVKL